MICVEWIDIDSPRKMAIIGVDGKFGNLGRLKVDLTVNFRSKMGRSPMTKMFSPANSFGEIAATYSMLTGLVPSSVSMEDQELPKTFGGRLASGLPPTVSRKSRCD
jgi:hypothetical protein